MMKNKKSSI